MLQISTFTFGGGFVIIGMMRKKFCDELHYVTDDEVLDMTAIAQSSPGALAINSAIIFGYRIKGIKGACGQCFSNSYSTNCYYQCYFILL